MVIKQAPEDFCPYVGLQPYSEADQEYFFGRERDSRVISSNLYAASLTVLYGASGVGKSSVLWAGVFPHLQRSQRTAVLVFDGWSDQNLLHTLKTRCLEAITEANGGRDLQIDIDLPLDELLFVATQASGCTLLIILDQFEEYFLYHPEADNQFDIEFARAVNREEVDCNFMVAMREDALSRLDRFRARIPHMLSNSLRLRHLDAPSARDAMRKPLEVYARQYPDEPSMSIEDALVEELIEDIQVEKLMIGQGGQGMVERVEGETGIRIEAPFLQLVLTRLWNEERAQGSQVLRLETLQALGGAGRIIRTHMDSAMDALTPMEQETVAGLFRYMVTPSGTKIAYTVADLEYYANTTRDLEPMLQKLAQGRVRILRPVTTPGEPGVIRYQIYHDVLAPAVLDWRSRFESSKHLLNVFELLIEKGDMANAFHVYQDIIQRTPQQAFFPEQYEVKRIVGKGELGVTYLLFDREKQSLVAATILNDHYIFTPEDLAQFTEQAGKVSSPRISRILGFDQHHNYTYMLSEYIDGRPLRARLDEEKPLAYMEAMQITREVTEALQEGHGQGMPHLSLRPSNILLTSSGVALVNYGIARLIFMNRNPNQPARKYMDDYLAPEQLSKEGGDARSDIYALGTVLYEMLIGHPPGVGRFYYPSEVNLEATEAVDILIDHARENTPGKRFASAADMRKEIDRITMTSVTRGLNQVLRRALAWTSEQYKKLITRKGLILYLAVLVGFLILSMAQALPYPVLMPARVITALLLNSFVLSILCDWVIRALARRRGLGSVSTSGRGMGAILGLVLTLNIVSSVGLRTIYWTSGMEGFYIAALAVVIFLAALALAFVVAISWISDLIFKSYTTGFYWSFVFVLTLAIILAILGQPENFFSIQ